MHSEKLYTELACDVEDCPAHAGSNTLRWIQLFEMIRTWGWKRVLSTSPHPPHKNENGSTWAWSITVYFCPEHAYLAEDDTLYTISEAANRKASYRVIIKEPVVEPRMSDLVAFLRARLDEDEARAKRGQPEPWVSDMSGRVFREVEAKREIVEHWQCLKKYDAPGNPDPDEFENYAVRPLATVYSDHPDYDPAWA